MCLPLWLVVSGCLLFSLGSHSYVSPSGDVLFLLHHDIIFDWSLSLFFTVLPLRLLVVSGVAPASTPDIDNMKNTLLVIHAVLN